LGITESGMYFLPLHKLRKCHGLHLVEEGEAQKPCKFPRVLLTGLLCYNPDLMGNHVFVTLRQQTHFENIHTYLLSAIR